uniref:PPM-type phosphatase domain-containing protein n=1 Tax=Trichobilharzia regenti TaxID=157069 RepID=A0AA85ITI1_TRIRE|nr:unnamed protein product [Trichobilharzia regenti]
MIPALSKFIIFCSFKTMCRLISRDLQKNYSTGKPISLTKLENLLYAGAGKVEFSNLIKSGVVTDSCPVKTVFVNQLAANNPIEDRWNVGLTEMKDPASSCLFTVLDGHSGTACVHALVWSLLDYMCASLMLKENLNIALEQLHSCGLQHPYHLLHRLDFVSPKNDKQHLNNFAGPPSKLLSAYMRGCLRQYMEDLYNQPNRTINPTECFIDAFKRIDDDLCSVNFPNILFDGQTTTTLLPFSSDESANNSLNTSLARDLMRVNLSGSVGIAGYLHWHDKLSNRPTELYLANTGDCGAVLLREVQSSSSSSSSSSNVEMDKGKGDKVLLTPIKCTKSHNGNCNPDEINRIAKEHPENSISELFREDGRLLGELAPCRSFGDVRYKWPLERLLRLTRFFEMVSLTFSREWLPLPRPYTSPPYLTALPEVTRIEITPEDRYLILATDGLWDMLTVEQIAAQLTDILELKNQQEFYCPATQLLWSTLTNVPVQMSRAILPV